MTPEQLTTLKAAILAETDPTFVALRNTNETGQMVEWLNQLTNPEYKIALSNVQTSQIGKVINYIAFESLTTANRDKLMSFISLNPSSFDGTRSDVRALLSSDTGSGVFSGALGGQGANTRAALLNIMIITANRAEKIFSTGAGTILSPSTSSFIGKLDHGDLVAAFNT